MVTMMKEKRLIRVTFSWTPETGVHNDDDCDDGDDLRMVMITMEKTLRPEYIMMMMVMVMVMMMVMVMVMMTIMKEKRLIRVTCSWTSETGSGGREG